MDRGAWRAMVHRATGSQTRLKRQSIAALQRVLFSAVQRSESVIRLHTSSFLNFLPIQVTTEHRVESPALSSRVSLVIYFIHSRVYTVNPTLPIHPTCPRFPSWWKPLILVF